MTLLGGGIRALGKQGLASISSFVSYDLICLPLAYYLTFYYGTHISTESKTLGQELPGLG